MNIWGGGIFGQKFLKIRGGIFGMGNFWGVGFSGGGIIGRSPYTGCGQISMENVPILKEIDCSEVATGGDDGHRPVLFVPLLVPGDTCPPDPLRAADCKGGWIGREFH